MAASTASRVSWNPDRGIWRPMADWPTPEITARRSSHSPAIERVVPVATKLGMANPPGPGSNPTSTSVPTATSSGGRPRRRPMTRTPGWSGNSTSTRAKGTSRFGSHFWWLTVKL